MRQFLRAFARDRKGATSIEYTLIGALVSLAIISAVDQLADSTNAVFQTVTSPIASVSDPGSSDEGSSDPGSSDDDGCDNSVQGNCGDDEATDG